MTQPKRTPNHLQVPYSTHPEGPLAEMGDLLRCCREELLPLIEEIGLLLPARLDLLDAQLRLRFGERWWERLDDLPAIDAGP